MLRHPSLIPLSHQHQHGLALCVQIERQLAAGRAPERTAALARRVADAYQLELRNHFDVEERILFPALRAQPALLPIVEELIGDHRALEALIAGVAAAADHDRPEVLAEFTARLSRHIRREERELFEEMQKLLPAEVLEKLGCEIDGAVVRVCL